MTVLPGSRISQREGQVLPAVLQPLRKRAQGLPRIRMLRMQDHP